MPAVDHDLVFAAAWSGSWPRTQVLPTEPASPAEPDSHPAAVAVHKPLPAQQLPPGDNSCLQVPRLVADKLWTGGRMRAGERLFPAAPQSGSTALAATPHPPPATLGPQMPLAQGDSSPPSAVLMQGCQVEGAAARPLPAWGGTDS